MQDSERPVGWAIVGIGGLSMGQILPGFAQCKRSKVVALVSGSPEKAKQNATKYGVPESSIYNYQTFDRIKDNPAIEAVYIVLPNGMHAEYTIRAAQAGKHVLCEKPMANTVKDCELMIAACKKANVKLMVAYRCRYEPYNQAAIAACRDPRFGKIKSIIADHGFNAGDPKQWRLNKKLAGGGSLMDIGIYSLNAARYLTGEEPASVTAQEYTDRNDPRFKEVEDAIHFTLKFPSGALANCTSSYGYSGANRYRVLGERGFVDMEPATGYTGLKLKYRTGGAVMEPELPRTSHFTLEMDHFSECIRENKSPLTPGEEGLADLRVIEAIYQAAKTGRTISLK
ncbi:MAG: Gfo/Idh/MocA family oxidoreductase [Armatimonas sp.]